MPQDPNDEPASELLTKIRKEREVSGESVQVQGRKRGPEEKAMRLSLLVRRSDRNDLQRPLYQHLRCASRHKPSPLNRNDVVDVPRQTTWTHRSSFESSRKAEQSTFTPTHPDRRSSSTRNPPAAASSPKSKTFPNPPSNPANPNESPTSATSWTPTCPPAPRRHQRNLPPSTSRLVHLGRPTASRTHQAGFPTASTGTLGQRLRAE